MPKFYENELKEDAILEITPQDKPVYYPRIIGQAAKESFTDFSNPRQKVISISPGTPSLDYQKALDSLNVIDGGTLILKEGTHLLSTITLDVYGNITVEGEGVDRTIIDFQGNAGGINHKGTSTAIRQNTIFRNFTLQNSNNAAALDFQYADFWKVENVRITSCDQKGLRVDACRNYIISNVRSDNNTGNGFEFVATASSDRNQQDFSVISCQADTNGGIGFSLAPQTTTNDNIIRFSFIGCTSNSNTGDGFDMTNNTDGLETEGGFMGCRSDANGGNGFDIQMYYTSFTNCSADNNTNDGFSIRQGSSFNGCSSHDNSGQNFDVSTTAQVSIIGCLFENSLPGSPGKNFATSIDNFDTRLGNAYGSTLTERYVYNMENTSGSDIAAGDVVTFASSPKGEEITTTTVRGDNKVFSMALTGILATAAGNAGPTLLYGFTQKLKVNGTDDIAIGSYLSTFSSVGIAALARPGDTVFAIALEAYATDDSLGVIDAYILPWRFIYNDRTITALSLSNGANNNIDTAYKQFHRITGPTAAFSISGFTKGYDGAVLTIYNSVAQDMTITNDATSTAANRILTSTGADVTLTGVSVVGFIYSTTDSRWLMVGSQG